MTPQAAEAMSVTWTQNLSDNERADLQEAINYDASTPITAFNTFLQFNSLFQEIKGQEDVWLANDSLDLPNDPDNHFIFEESLRAVLNTDCEVQIADTIYKFVPTGYYSIPVSQSRNDRALVELAGSIYYHGNDDCDECKSYLKTYNEEGDEKIYLNDWLTIHFDLLAEEENFHKVGSILLE